METLAVAFEKRLKPPPTVRSVRSPRDRRCVNQRQNLHWASASRRKGIDLETVLVDEFQVQLKHIGEALGKYYGFPMEAYRADRSIPLRTKAFARSFVERHEWLVIESSDERIHVLCTDPEELIEHPYRRKFLPQCRHSLQRRYASRFPSNRSRFLRRV